MAMLHDSGFGTATGVCTGAVQHGSAEWPSRIRFKTRSWLCVEVRCEVTGSKHVVAAQRRRWHGHGHGASG